MFKIGFVLCFIIFNIFKLTVQQNTTLYENISNETSTLTGNPITSTWSSYVTTTTNTTTLTTFEKVF
jgi:hypothetical protein